MKKVVLKLLEIYDEKDKQKAMKAVSSISGVESISIDMKDQKLTVIGDVDPIAVVNKLRKLWDIELLTVGPAKESEKKDEKKDNEKKDNDTKKYQYEELKYQYEELQDLVKAYHSYNNPYMMRQYVVEENPNACVIC